MSITIASGALFVLVIAFYPSSELKERVQSLKAPTETKSGQTRLQSWNDALGMWQTFPALGIGAESFRTTYPAFQSVNSRKTLLYAENEYIQSLTEFGILGMGILAGCTILLFTQWIKPSNPAANTCSAISIWLIGATMIHCLFDFPLRHPSNAIGLCILIGLMLPTPAISKHPSRKWHGFTSTQGVSYSLIIIALLGIMLQGKQLWRLDSGEYLNNANKAEVIRALSHAPTFSYAWQLLGEQFNAEAQQAESTQAAFKLQDEALRCFHRAAIYNPSNYRQWRFLGHKALEVGDKPLATIAFEKAIELRPYLKNDLEKQLHRE